MNKNMALDALNKLVTMMEANEDSGQRLLIYGAASALLRDLADDIPGIDCDRIVVRENLHSLGSDFRSLARLDAGNGQGLDAWATHARSHMAALSTAMGDWGGQK